MPQANPTISHTSDQCIYLYIDLSIKHYFRKVYLIHAGYTWKVISFGNFSEYNWTFYKHGQVLAQFIIIAEKHLE